MTGNKRIGQGGQTLLIVIFAMSLGLLVVVNTANRVVASVARTTQSNNYQKSIAIAEAGAELFLAKPYRDYPSLAVTCPATALVNLGGVNSNCVYASPSGEAKAYVGVERYPKSEEKDLKLRSRPGETVQINLQGLNSNINVIQVCWKGLGRANYSASYYFYYYGTPGNYSVDKGMYTCKPSTYSSSCSLPDSEDMRYIPQADEASGYSCYAFWTRSDSAVLRIFTFPDGADYLVSAYGSGATPVQYAFPPQGYRIISIGEVTAGGLSLDPKKAPRKKVTVDRTFPYPTGPWWDFALTSVDGSVTTSP